MSEPEKQFIIGINTEVECPEGWMARLGGNLTFTVSTLAADQAAALARIDALDAAARAVLPHLWVTAHTDSVLSDVDVCMVCGAERALGHDTGCPVAVLEALLGEPP